MTPNDPPPFSPIRSFWDGLSLIEKLATSSLLVMAIMQTVVMLFAAPAGDASNHIFRIQEWHRMWQQGILYPRWLSSALHGFGSPAFYFYPPLVYVIASLVYAVLPSFSADAVFRVVTVLATLCSMGSFLFYLRSRKISGWRSWIAALLYGFAPYRYLDTQVRGAIAEHTAFIFLPLILFGVDRLLIDAKKDRWSILTIALGCFGLLITNIPASTVGLVGLAVYAVAQYRRERRSLIWIVFGAAGLGICLAAFSLLPALLFGGAIRHELFQQVSYRFGQSNTPLLDIFSLKNITINLFGVVTIVGALLMLPALLVARSSGSAADQATNRAWRWTIYAVLFVQSPYLSGLMFEYFPPAVLVQFPWRFDMLLLPVVSILLARDLQYHASRSASLITLAWVCMLFLVMGTRAAGLSINHHNPAASDSTWEYMVPKWALPQDTTTDKELAPFRTLPEVSVVGLNSHESVQLLGTAAYADSLVLNFQQQHEVSFHRNYWPQWQVSSDGESIRTSYDTIGRLTITIGPGRHRVTLQLTTSSAEQAGWLTSGAALCAIFWVGFRRKGTLG
ncbi:MAG: hypothetical protein Q8922_05635 [Bacteroidota bacterium]|nr:hypothetical protein [Bacteroidota bacterium]MDP4233115.1 hypothetical protein [Bacteroidota bacterium]MDP4287398.1 hypothetical protein [Bacteroidota bacterium]